MSTDIDMAVMSLSVDSDVKDGSENTGNYSLRLTATADYAHQGGGTMSASTTDCDLFKRLLWLDSDASGLHDRGYEIHVLEAAVVATLAV